jgi:serine/threonine protein kinase
VAIKKSNIVVKREIDEFINEVAILSQINHRNIVKLHGCCLEIQVPLLAYEFIANGTLSDHLHTEEPRSLAWKDRLRITNEIAKALAYLHSAVSVPVIHRDIKPSNILLDEALTAKVSDFGASRYIPIDQTGTATAVQGTIGYLDPMYYYTGRLTENSDVYSFGVLLVELLTRRKPSLYRSSEGDGLVMQFLTLLAHDNLSEILDPQVVEEGGGKVKEVATIAASCIKLRGEERPTMRQVEMTLEALQTPNESVSELIVEETNETMNYPRTNKRAKQGESSRCYSLEEEVLLSATYPR